MSVREEEDAENVLAPFSRGRSMKLLNVDGHAPLFAQPDASRAMTVTLPRPHSQAGMRGRKRSSGRQGDASGARTQTICPGSSTSPTTTYLTKIYCARASRCQT